MMVQQFTGTLAVVARTGGIKFEGQDVWLNPTDEAKQYVKHFSRGDVVTITGGPKENTFSYIVAAEEEHMMVSEEPINDEAPENRNFDLSEVGDAPSKELLIIRQAVLKTTATALSTHNFNDAEFFRIAQKMESWVIRGVDE